MQNNINLSILVVFYNPTEEQMLRWNYLGQTFHIIGVDNSYSDHRSDLANIDYVSLKENKGIAFAQNLGIDRAKKKGIQYVIFFDQDSYTDEQFVNALLKEYQEIRSINDNIATLGPIIIEEETHKEYKSDFPKDKQISEVSSVISSGSISEIMVFDKVGKFDGTLFIDLVDCEWCWRAKEKGYSVYQTRNVQLLHTVGKKYFVLCGVAFGVSSAIRYFYYYRNALWLMRRSYVPTNWKYKTIARMLLDMAVIPFVSDEGGACFLNMVKGLWSGITDCHEVEYS